MDEDNDLPKKTTKFKSNLAELEGMTHEEVMEFEEEHELVRKPKTIKLV
jgi:hypothetical protein